MAINVMDGQVVNTDEKFVYLALYRTQDTAGWIVPGVLYFRAEDVETNLAFFHPTEIVVVRVPQAALMKKP